MGLRGRWLRGLFGIAAVAALAPATAAADGAPDPGHWLKEPHDVILGYGCTDFQLEPVDPRFNCPSGDRVHEGIDFDTPIGTPVYDGLPGVVTAVGAPETHDFGPHYLRIALDEGHDLILGHLSAATVKVGERVRVGQVLGYTGDLGETNVPNLHFEVRERGGSMFQSVDPSPFLTLQSFGPVPEPGGAGGASPRPAGVVDSGFPDPRPYVLAFVAAVGFVLLGASLIKPFGSRPSRP